MRGVYLVAAELARRGFIASPTSRSAQGADLLVTDQRCSKAFSVQVKTNASAFSFFLVGAATHNLRSRSHVFVLVNLRRDRTEFFVVPSRAVSDRIVEWRRKTGTVWYGVLCRDLSRYKERWDVFGAADAAPPR